MRKKGNNYDSSKHSFVRPVKCLETGEVWSSLQECSKSINIYSATIRKAIENNTLIKGKTFIFLEGEERIKSLANAIYCKELNKYYESPRQARVEDGFHQGCLGRALKDGNPYLEKKYAGYTFSWVNPKYHL